MKLNEVMKQLAALGSEQTKKTHCRHGAPEPLFGVKIGDMKPLVKALKGQQALALELYATGNSDAMYLAGLIANGALMTPAQLDEWVSGSRWQMHSGTTVPVVAVEHPDAVTLGLKWIDSADPLIAVAGWATLANAASILPDDQLPLNVFDKLLSRAVKDMTKAPDRVRYTMNSFIICVGTYCAPLAEKALIAAQRLGTVDVDMGDTACKVPVAADYIIKSRRGAPVAPKKKTARC